jgi:spore germination protein KC
VLEGFLGKSLHKLVDERVGAVVTLKDFQQMITGEAGGAILPYINTKAFKKVEKDDTVDSILETAIFKQDRMVGKIDQKLTKGVLWLTNNVYSSAMTVRPPNGEGTITMDPIPASTYLVPSIKNNKWKITAKITAEGSIVQNGTDLNVMNPEVNRMLQKEMAKAIQIRIKQSLEKVQKEMKTDVFNFAETFERKYPNKWDKAKEQWEEIFPQVEVDFDIHTYVRRPGLATRPGGLPKKEVKME